MVQRLSGGGYLVSRAHSEKTAKPEDFLGCFVEVRSRRSTI
jgi:hypothetical protein